MALPPSLFAGRVRSTWNPQLKRKDAEVVIAGGAAAMLAQCVKQNTVNTVTPEMFLVVLALLSIKSLDDVAGRVNSRYAEMVTMCCIKLSSRCVNCRTVS